MPMRADLYVAVDLDKTIYDPIDRGVEGARRKGLSVSREEAERIITAGRSDPQFTAFDFDGFYDAYDSPELIERMDTPIRYAPEVLRDLKESVGIAYATARPEGEGRKIREATIRLMKKDEIPNPDEDPDVLLIMKPRFVHGKDARRIKRALLYGLANTITLIGGVGDEKTDAEAYLENGVPAMILDPADAQKKLEFPAGTIFLSDWREIGRYIKEEILRKGG